MEGHVPGSEVAGTVTAVGDDVDTSWVGRRVWAFTGVGGGYVERAIAPVEEILPLPAGLSAVGAVTLGSSGVVAHFGLSHGRFAPGESVLVRGAAGSIGIMTVQLAARGGAASDHGVDAADADRLGGDQHLPTGGTGAGRSMTARPSGPPNVWIATAFNVVSLLREEGRGLHASGR